MKNIWKCDRIGHRKEGKRDGKSKIQPDGLIEQPFKGAGGSKRRQQEKREAGQQDNAPQQAEENTVVNIDVHDLVPSQENFYHVDDELKRSIELVGILQPLLVSRPENGKYRVIAGHRRRLAVLSPVRRGERGNAVCALRLQKRGREGPAGVDYGEPLPG